MKSLAPAGIAAPVIYLAAVVAGGLVTPGYSHIAMPISAMMAGGAGPWWLNGMLLAYNLALLCFGLWLPIPITRPALLASALVGLGLLVFPMDGAGTPMSQAGLIHLLLAAAASLASLAAIAGGTLYFSRWRDRRRTWLSAAALALVLVTGALTAIGTAAGWPIAGLLERLTIGGFLCWVGWLAHQSQSTTS